MDFNLILLILGLGLLGIVILFALWGFLGGLKRELSCIAVFIILLVLAWLVFGNSGVLLNYSGGLVDTIRSTLNLPQKDATVWETILDYLKSMEGLNLSALLVEGKETYSFVYNLCSCIATIVLLVVSTLAVVIITPIIRLISHIVILIIHGVKKHKAKKQAAEGNASEESAEENANNEEADDAILVLKGVEGADDAVVTVSEEELPEPKKSKKRVWGAVAGVLKGVFLIILLFAPISGIYSIMKTATPETRELISDLVTGNQTQQNVAEQNGPVDMAFDFVDEYKDSAVGKFVESSSYFFGQSLSTLLFDSMASINTSTQNIKLRQELIVYLEAVNALEGNIEVGTWTDEQLAAALDVLKDSKLLPEAMPVAIEYASEIEFLKSALDKAMQTTAFLALRDLDWDKEVETILDTVKEVYKLDLFPLEDFNVLTMNEQVLNQVINALCEGEFINTLLPILVKTGVKLEAVQNLTGNYDPKNLNLTDISWKVELNGLVDVYTIFKEYGYTDLAQITDTNVNDLVESLVVNKTDVTVKLLERLTEMTVFNNILIPVAQSAVDSYLANEQNGFTEFANIINLKDLTIEQWKEDINAIIEVAKLAVDKINVLSLDLKQMDIESKEAIDAMKEIVQSVLTLNLLGDDKTKNDLVLAAIIKFNLLDVDDLYVTSADGTSKVSIFENVNWTTDGDNIGEIDTIKNILEIYKQFVLLDEVNMKDLNIDFVALLDNEDGVDILVSILEELVDSDLTLSLIDPAVNKYLLPITNEFDDDNLVKDIFNNISNKEMAEEIIKIVKAIKDAQTLGLFDVAKNGLGSLKYSETDALINIINTIFDSKILDGVEGRVIRIIFKATKILDIEKGLLDNINFDGEQEILVNFIHAIENVLQDPNFVLFDEAGNVTLDLEYITQPEIFSQLMSGVEIVLGTLEKDENGNFVETSGSKLVEALLPNIMSTYVIKSIPEEFKGLVEIVDLENLDSALLASDVRRLTYIARQLVEMDLQTIFVNGSIVYTDKLENVYNILDALLGMEMLKPCGNEVFAWIINYVSDKFLAQYNIEEVTAEDFAGVDWAVEAETAKALITQIIEFLEVNNLESTAELIDFINEKGYLTTSFVTTENANRVLEILNTALELNTIEAIAPIAFQVVVNQLVSNNVISKDFWEGSLTGEELVEDLYSVTEIAEILVNDIDFVEMWRASFQGEAIVLPEDTAVNEIIDKLFSLNLVKGYENELVQFALEKYLPKNDVISVESFNVQSITNWDNEVATIKGVVSIVLNILAENEFENVAQITDFINNIKNSSNVVEGLKAYITDNNISLVAGLLDEVVNSQLVANVLPDVVSYGLEQLAKQVIDLQFINDLTAEELQADVHKLVEIINVLVEERIACFIVNKTVEVESKNVYGLLETAKAVVGKINELNLVTKHENELMSTLINKAFELAKLTDFTLSASDLENVDWNDEFTSIQQILTIVQNFAADNHLVVYRDVTKYLDEVKADVKVIVTEVNGRHIVSAVKELANMGTVKALLPQVLSFGIDKAYEAGYDIRFVDEAKLTNDEIANDIVTFANIVIDLIDLGAVKLYKNETIGNLNEAVVKDIANQLANVNILAKFAGEWTAFVVNFALDKLNIKDFNVRYNAENFAGLSDEQWTNDTEKLGNALFAVVSALDELFPAGYSIESIKQFISNKEYSNYDIFTNTLIDCVVDALSNVLAINLIDPIVNDFVSFGVDKLANVALFKDIDVQFIKEIATREVLSHDVINLGEIAKTMIEFGLFEYLETKTLQKVELDKLNPIFDQIDQMELFQVNRETWMEFIANTVMTAAKLDVRYTAEDFATITDEIATESIQTVKSVVSQLAELLAYWQLESLEEITSFVSGKGYTSATYITDEAVISITEIVDTITTIVPLQSMLPKLAQYGLSKVPEKYDLSFVEPYLEDGTLSGSVLAEDIRTIMAIVVDGVNFGALDLVYKVYEEQPFEVKFEYISSIIEKIDTLHVLEIDYNSWISFASNIGFELAKSVVRVQPEDFAYMTNDAWHEDFATLASIVNSIGEIAKNNNLTFYDDINLFIKEKGYTSAQYVTDENVSDILSVVDTIIGINFIDPYLVKGLSSLIDYVIIGNEALPDMKFVSTAIDNHEYISSDIKDDLRTVIEMARNVLDFGAIEIYFTQQLSVINVEPIQNIIANINELHLFHLSEAKWFENIFTQVFKALKLDENKYHVSANEYITMNRAEWDQDFESLSHIVGLIGELLDESSITSSSELTEFINNKYYTLAQYVTDENVLVIAEIIETLGGIKALSPALDDLVRYALSEKVNIANVDLSFLVDALENRELTGEMLSSDIQSLASIIKDAVEIGVIDYVYFNKLPELNYDLIKNILVTATGLNTIVVAIDNWAALGFNQLFKALKIENTVSAEDFAMMNATTWSNDVNTIIEIVDRLEALLKANDLNTIEDVQSFFKDKLYTLAQYANNENALALVEIVDLVGTIRVIEPALPVLAKFGVSKVSTDKFDVSFLESHFESDLTGEKLSADIRTVAAMLKEIVEFGTIDYFFYQELDQIQIVKLQNVLTMLNELNIYSVDKESWLVLTVNQLLAALNVEERVTVDSFAGLNPDNEIMHLVDALGEVDALLRALNIVSTNDLKQFIQDKGYINGQYVTDETLDIVLNAVEDIQQMQTLKVLLPVIARWGVDKIASSDLDFLKEAMHNDTFTAEELVEDVKTVISIARNCVALGVFDAIFDIDMETIDGGLVATIVSQIENIHIFNKLRSDWVALGLNKALSALEINVTPEELDVLTKAQWLEDNQKLQNALVSVAELMERLGLTYKSAIVNYVSAPDYKELLGYKELLSEIISNLLNTNTTDVIFDKVLHYVVVKAENAGVDISFLEGNYHAVDLANDVLPVLNAAENLVDFGIEEIIKEKQLSTIELQYVGQALLELENTVLYSNFNANWLVVLSNKLLETLKIEERVTVDSFAGLDLSNEMTVVNNTLLEVQTLLDTLGLESSTQVKEFVESKNYTKQEFVTNENVELALNVVDTLVSAQTLKVLLPIISRWGVDKITGSDLDFLKEAMHNDTFTSSELVEDVQSVVEIARKALQLGVRDFLFDIAVLSYDRVALSEIVAKLAEVNVYSKLRGNWLALGLNKVLASLEISVEASEFNAITAEQWAEDNQKLQNALVALCDLLEEQGLTYLTAVQVYMSQGTYKDNLEEIFNNNLETLKVVLSNLIGTHTVNVVFPKVLHYAVVKAADAGYDISFLEGSYASSDLANDVSPILNIVQNLLAFGVKEYIDTKDISSIEVEYIANAVAEIENALVFTKYRNSWVNILIDKAVTALKIDQEIDYSVISLTDEQWKSDNVTLQSLVLKLGEILDNNNLNKYSEVVSFFKDEKKHTLEETYTDTNVALIADAIKLVLSFNSVECLFPQVVCLAINKAYDFNLDLLFLASSLQMEVVKNDVDVLVQMFKPLCKFGLFEIINTKQLQFLNVEYLNPVIDLIPSLGIYNLNRNAWAASLANCLAHALKSDIRVSESDFVGVDWDVENDLFQELVSAVDKFLVETDLVSIDNIKDLQARGFKLQEQYATSENANNLVDVVAAISNLATFNVLSKDLVDFGLAKLETSGLSLTYLTDKVDNNEVTEDVKSIVVALRKLIEFGVVEQMFAKAEINYNAKATLYEAIEKVLNLNVLVNNGNNVVLSIFDKLGIDASRAVGTVVFREEYDSIVTILDSVFTIFENYKITTYEEIAKVVSIIAGKGLRIDKSFNENIQALADIIDVLYKDDLFAFVIMPISEKYLSNEKLAGLADLHNIYSNVSELNSDLHNVYVVLSNIQSLNIYDCLIGNADYPFDRTFNFTNIINNLFTLNYFNNPGRMDAFVNGLDNLITSVDLSSVNGNNISLADDADDIVEMVKNISAVLTNPDFPIKNKEDIDNKISVSINFFLRQENLDLELAAIKNYMNTTLYGETGAAILIVILPLLKNVLNDYWTALDLDNYSAEMINHDTPYIMAIIETLVNLDYNAIGDGSLAYSALESDVDAIIDNLVELQLLDGHYNDLVALLLRDFVYGKTFGNVTIEQDAFNIENVDFEHDLIVAKDIFRAFIELMASEGNNTMREVSDYFVSFDSKAFLNNDAAMNKVAEIVEYVAQLTIIEQNALALYNTFAVPSLGDNVKYVDYRSATNEELYADLVKVPEVIRLAVAMNVFGIIDGETIDYVGADGLMADHVEQLLNILASTNYIELHFAKIINRLSNKFEGLRTYGASYETIDVAGDANKVAQAYRVLVPYLSSSEFPVKTINDFGKLLTKQTIIDAQGYGEYLVNAYEILAQTSVAPYVVPTVVNKAKEFVGGRLQSIVNVLTTDGLTLEQLTNDVLLSITLVKDVYESRIYRFVLDKDLTFPTSEVAVEIVDTALSMNIISTKFNELVKAVFVEFNIDTADIDFAAFDCETEKQIIKAVVSETFDILAECELTTLSAVKAEIKDLINTVKVSRRSFARKVVDLLSNVQKECFVRIIETIAESQLFVETFIPVYNKVLSKYGSLFGTYEEYLSLEGYTKAALDSDVEIFAQAVRALFESKLHQVYTAKAYLSDSQMAAAQTSVRLFGQLQILELKKQAAVDILEKLVKVDLSDIDVNTIDVEFDFNLLAEALPMLCTVIRDSNLQFSVRLFGNTELMNAAIDVLELFFESTTSKEFMPVIVRKATNKLSSMINVTFSEKTDEQVYSLCDDIIVALRALSEMGAFSNNGVDFTNAELTDKVFAVIYNNVNLRSYKKYFDKFVRNIAEYGVISLNYEAASTSNEISVAKGLIKQLITFVKTYVTYIKNKDLSIVSDPVFQADVTSLVNKALESDLLAQVFMPVIVGTTKVATENYGKFAMFTGMTNSQFVNVALPDLFQIVSYVETLGLFRRTINYKDVDTIVALADLVVTSPVTKDLLNDLIPAAFKFAMKINLDRDELAAANVDYVNEVSIITTFLRGIESELQNISISDPSTMMTQEFLLAVANNGAVLENSKLAQLYMKRVMRKVINKVSSTTDALDFMLTALNDPSYTNEQAMDDYLLILKVMKEAAYINFFGADLDFAALDGHIDVLLDNLFALHAVDGNEEAVMSMILSKLSFVDTSSIDLSVVSDWDQEFASFTEMCAALATLCADPNFDIENMTTSMFENSAIQTKFVAFVDKASESYVGSEMFKELFKTKVDNNLPADAQGIIDIDTLPRDKWAEEFEELFEIYVVISQGISNMTFNDVLSAYDVMFGLNGKDGIEAVKADYKYWLTKLIDQSNFTVPNSNVRIKTELIPDDNALAYNEVVAVREVIVNMASYLDPATDKICDFDYVVIETSKDYVNLADTLIAVSKALSMREVILGVVSDAVNNNSDESGKSTFVLAEMISDAFKRQYATSRVDYTGYDEMFWTEEELTKMAIIVACANALELDSEGATDIYTMDLGTTYPDVTVYENVVSTGSGLFPSQVAGANQVGLRQMLQLFVVSNVFDISCFGGEDGVIATKLESGANPILSSKFNRPLGTLSSEDEFNETIALTNALADLRDLGLIDGTDIASSLYSFETAKTEKLLRNMNESVILRPMLAVIVYEATKETMVNHGGLNEVQAATYIETYLPDLANQYNASNPLASKEDYNAIISSYINTIKGFKGEI